MINEVAFTSVKTKRDQIISLNKTAVDILNRCPKLFIDHIHRNSINRSVQDIAIKLEINKPISFHVGRHTFATSFLRAGGKVEQLQPLLGHSKINTTMIYVHILQAEANKQIFLLDELFQ
jgi:site-specific recombinase XerD